MPASLIEKTDLSGRVAFVTGGGGGIGRGIAMALASAGADVAVLDIEEARAVETAQAINGLGRDSVAHTADVTDPAQLRAAISETAARLGPVDLLVNNAGGVRGRPFLEQSERSWQRHIDINLVSMLTATSEAASAMVAAGHGGAILNVSSIEGQRAAPNYAVYAACKAAMLSFTRTMALELAEHGIRVNAIMPDQTVTPGNRGNRSGPVDETTWIVRSAAQRDAVSRYVPLAREGLVEDCGLAAVYLMSPMSSYVTGAILPVDGGTWAASGWSRSSDGAWVLGDFYPGRP